MLMTSLVIFDLDGTLLNSIDDLGDATNYALSQCGFPTHDISAYPMFVGNGITKLLERALPSECRENATIEKMRAHFLEYYDNHNTQYTKPYNGIPQLLKTLSSQGINLAVASNKYHEAVVKLTKYYFPHENWVAIEGHKNGIATKPNPAIVFNILQKCPTPKDQVLYIGDSGVDIDTACRAEIKSIGVTWGFRSEEELRAHNANYLANTPDEIYQIISKL